MPKFDFSNSKPIPTHKLDNIEKEMLNTFNNNTEDDNESEYNGSGDENYQNMISSFRDEDIIDENDYENDNESVIELNKEQMENKIIRCSQLHEFIGIKNLSLYNFNLDKLALMEKEEHIEWINDFYIRIRKETIIDFYFGPAGDNIENKPKIKLFENTNKLLLKLFKLNSKADNVYEKCKEITKKYEDLEDKYNFIFSELKRFRLIKIKRRQKDISSLNNKNINLIKDLDEIEKEFYEIYNNSLTTCKNIKCKTMCADDIGYCLEHMPQACEKCNKIVENDKFDRLNKNKKHNIENYCNSCTQEIYFQNYIDEYKYKDIIHVIDENDKFYKTKLSLAKQTFLDMEKDSEILHGIDNPSSLQEKEILEFYGYKTDDYNDFTKYKLYNRITRSSELLNEFGDKLLYLKIKPSFYSYIGKSQYLAFKDFLYKILDINKIDNVFNVMKLNIS
jgi:hypothetical protein